LATRIIGSRFMRSQTDGIFTLCSLLAEHGERRAATAVAQLASHQGSPSSSWEGVVSVAAGHLLLPALWKALGRKGLGDQLPPDVKDFLNEVYVLNATRNKALRAQAAEIVTALSQSSISSVLLKGGAFLFDSEEEDLGDRMMVDLDLLVPERRLAESVAALKDLGYETFGDEKSRPHHYPPLFREGEVATVELHWSTGERTELLPAESVFRDARTPELGASKVWIPSASHRIIHAIYHAAIQDDDFRRGIFSLKALHDVITIAKAHPSLIDWELIDSSMRRCGFGRVLEAQVYLADRLLNWPPPPGVSPTWRAALHYRRCLVFMFIRDATTPYPRASLKSFMRKMTIPGLRQSLGGSASG
jgi:hypothetical protein